MNKHLLTQIILLLFTNFLYGQNDLEIKGLNGKVKAYKEISYAGVRVNDEYLVDGHLPRTFTYYEFNQKGIVERSSYFNSGVERISTHIYNKDGSQKIQESRVGDSLTNRTIYTLENHYSIKTEYYDGLGELLYWEENEYGPNGVTLSKVYRKDSALVATTTYEYLNGQVSKVLYRNKHNGFAMDYEHEYNVHGDVVATKGGHTFYNEYKYDRYFNWIECVSYNSFDKDEIEIVKRQFDYYDDPLSIKSEDDLLGVWCVVNTDYWIKFEKDNKFNKGKLKQRGERAELNGKWQYDFANKTVTITNETSKETSVYTCFYKGLYLVLKNDKEELLLERG
ncbi:MAG: hypothetical protein JXQ87_08460 [Bacteroidia bacterium]